MQWAHNNGKSYQIHSDFNLTAFLSKKTFSLMGKVKKRKKIKNTWYYLAYQIVRYKKYTSKNFIDENLIDEKQQPYWRIE